MPDAAAPIERLEQVLFDLELPEIVLVDVGWGPIRRHKGISEAFRYQIDPLGIEYRRPKLGSCDTLPKFQGLVNSYVEARTQSKVTVLLHARTSGNWRFEREILRNAVGTIADLKTLTLTAAATRDHELAIGELADLLAGRSSQDEVELDEETRRLGQLVMDKAGVSDPLVVVVGGIPEKQGRAAAAFEQRIREEYGINGKWIFTDYAHPERAVSELENLCQASITEQGTRVVAVLFSQKLNATNVKRDGMRYLREKGILPLAPTFRSVESALREVKTALKAYLGESGTG